MKPPSNVHSCHNLMRTNSNSSDVSVTESSPYMVKNAKVLLFQDRVAVMTGSSFDRGEVAILPP